MKEATGELNMTVVTVVAVAAIGVLFYTFIWPMIQLRIAQQTCQSFGANYTAVEEKDGVCGAAPAGTTKCEPASTGGTADDGTGNGKRFCCCH